MGDNILDFHKQIEENIEKFRKEEEGLTILIDVNREFKNTPYYVMLNSYKEGKAVDHIAAALAKVAASNNDFKTALKVACIALGL